MDPVGVLLGKIDKETNQNKPEGSLPMEGALFEVKFYAGVQMDSDPAADGKKADKTWVFKTDEDGFCQYEKKYLSSGDELYMSLDGNPGLPIGTLTFKETQVICSIRKSIPLRSQAITMVQSLFILIMLPKSQSSHWI